jgi:hypothetical protein
LFQGISEVKVTEEELKAIEYRIEGRKRPLAIGDQVTKTYKNGDVTLTVTSISDGYFWCNGDCRYGEKIENARREPSVEDDIHALLAEVRRLTPPTPKQFSDQLIEAITNTTVYVDSRITWFHKEVLRKLVDGKEINGINETMFWFKRGKIRYSRDILRELQTEGLIDGSEKPTPKGKRFAAQRARITSR